MGLAERCVRVCVSGCMGELYREHFQSSNPADVEPPRAWTAGARRSSRQVKVASQGRVRRQVLAFVLDSGAQQQRSRDAETKRRGAHA